MTTLLNQNDFFVSPDIALCAALCILGYKIENIDKRNPSRAFFFIRRDPQLDEFIKLYFSHRLQVEPVSYFNSLKELKTRIYHI